MPSTILPEALPDDALLREAARLTRVDREATAAMIRVLMEVDARRLYFREGCSSLFVWCVQVLRLEEGAAYNRIEVARVARRIPAVLDALARGWLTLTAVRLLAPHLTAANHRVVLSRARGLRKREVQRLVAELAPRPDVPSTIRRVTSATCGNVAPDIALSSAASSSASSVMPPGRADTLNPPASVDVTSSSMTDAALDGAQAGTDVSEPATGPRDTHTGAADTESDAVASSSPGAGASVSEHEVLAAAQLRTGAMPALIEVRPAAVVALSATRFKLQVTIAEETHAKLRLAQDLLRHTLPEGDLAEVLDRALTVLVRHLERQRFAATATPRPARTGSSASPAWPASRYVPAFVRRAVWQRDGGQCAFVGRQGRCHERAWLEFHHRLPYAAGGMATVDNISLRCRAHNAYEASLFASPGAATNAEAGTVGQPNASSGSKPPP